MRLAPKDMPLGTDGMSHLFLTGTEPVQLIAVSTTGCIAIQSPENPTRVFHWYFRSKGQEFITLPPTPWLILWSCRAPWNTEPCGHITRLHVTDCGLTSLDARELTRLAHLQCANNKLERLDCCSMANPAAQVTRKPPVIVRKSFDPDNLPTPRPPVAAGESAVCISDSIWDLTFESRTTSRLKTPTGCQASIEILSGHLTVALNITIWLPNNAPPWLKDHEDGHRQISEKVYASADQAAKNALQLCLNHTFVGTGSTPALAEQDAKSQATRAASDDYNAHIPAVWQRVNDIYDNLTNHGANSIPDRPNPITVPDAIRQAFDQYTAETPATQPAK